MPESYTPQFPKKRLKQQITIYFEIFKMPRFIIFSLFSSLIMTFTLAFYSLTPFIFHQMGVNAMVNGLMCIPYAVGLVAGAYLLSTRLYHFDSEKTFAGTIYFSPIFLIFTIIAAQFYENLFLIGGIAFMVGLGCGIAAALSLGLAMQGFKTNRGAASAVQAFVRYFFAGMGLLCCNFIQLTRFYQLVLIFLGISITMCLIYRLASFTRKNRTNLLHA